MMLGLLLIFTTAIYGQSVPTITGFTPTIAATGDNITFSGTFSSQASDFKVFLGEVECPVASSTPTQLVATVPNGARSARFFITNVNTGEIASSVHTLVLKFANQGTLASHFNDGKFTLSTSFRTNSEGSKNVIKLTDVNGDGSTDILSGVSTTSVGYFSNLSNSLNAVTSSSLTSQQKSLTSSISWSNSSSATNAVVFDADMDGDLDLIALQRGQRGYTIKNNGSSYTAASISNGHSAPNMTIYDPENDGDLDMLSSYYAHSNYKFLHFFVNSGAGSFGASNQSSSAKILAIDAAVIDNDDYPEAVYVDGTQLKVRQNTTGTINPSVSTLSTLSFSGTASFLRLLDFNGDGINDIILSTSTGQLYVWPSNGTASISFGSVIQTSISGSITGFDVIDLDGDNDLDFVVSGSSGTFLLENDGTNSFTTTTLSTTTNLQDIAITDLNGNGEFEILGFASNSINVLPNYTFNPQIALTLTTWSFDKCASSNSNTVSASLTGQDLGSNSVEIQDNSILEYSIDNGSTWTTSLSVTPSSGSVSQSLLIRVKSSQNTDVAGTSLDITANTASTLTVNFEVSITAPTVITTQPSNAQVCVGGTDPTLSATATGDNLTYQWFSNTTNSNTGGTSLGSANGAQTSNLTASAATTGTTYYHCVVSGTCGSVTSNTSEVQISPLSVAGTITASSTEICDGGSTSLSLSGNTGTIQWQSSTDNSTWADITGETQTSLTTPSASSSVYYRTNVTSGACSSVQSNVIQIDVKSPPYAFDRVLDFAGNSSEDPYFNGTSTSLELQGSTDLTIEAWIYPTAFNFLGAIVSKGGSGESYRLAASSNGKLSFTIASQWSNWTLESSDNALILNEWQHVAGTYDGTTKVLTIYVNGVQVGQNTNPQGFNLNGSYGFFRLGKDAYQSSRIFEGKMDEVRLWNITRSSSDIVNDKNSELTGSESGLMAYYQFDEGLGSGNNTSLSSLTDSSPNGNDLTINSGMTMSGTSSNIIQEGPKLNGESQLCLGETEAFTHTVTGGTWSVGSSGVLSIDASGNVTANTTGTETVSYAYTFNGCSYTDQQSVTVVGLPNPGTNGTLDICSESIL